MLLNHVLSNGVATGEEQACTQWALYIYISGVRSSGHRVKPNMAANGGPNLRRLILPTRSFMFTCIVKIAQGDWNRRDLGPPCPPYLASLFARSVTGRSHSIYIYIYGAHCLYLVSHARLQRIMGRVNNPRLVHWSILVVQNHVSSHVKTRHT